MLRITLFTMCLMSIGLVGCEASIHTTDNGVDMKADVPEIHDNDHDGDLDMTPHTDVD